VLRALLVCKAARDRLEQLVFKEFKEALVVRERLELREGKDQQEPQEPQEQLGHKGQQV
jgi:hypothetical protein